MQDKLGISCHTIKEDIDKGYWDCLRDSGTSLMFLMILAHKLSQECFLFTFSELWQVGDLTWTSSSIIAFVGDFLSCSPGELPLSRGLVSDISLMNFLSEHLTLNSREGQWVREGCNLHFLSNKNMTI